MAIQVLLLQARRSGDSMASHEHACFVETTGLDADDIAVHDLTEGAPSLATIRRHDAVMVGGSGDYYVSSGNLPYFEDTLDRLRDIVATGHPMFASCFGYQCLVQALGAEVVSDKARAEVGTYDVWLTAEAVADPLFSLLPPRFWAQMGHQDRAITQPEGIPNFAFSENCPLQALRIPDAPIWATQFHPELDRESNSHRYRFYLDKYAANLTAEDHERALSQFRESPYASALLRGFLDLVFG